MVTMVHPDQDPGTRFASGNGSEDAGMPDWYHEAEEVERTRKVPHVGSEVDEDEAEETPEQASTPGQAPVDPFADSGVAPEAEPQEFPKTEESGQVLADEIERWRKEAEQNREKWLRAMAELENFRKLF